MQLKHLTGVLLFLLGIGLFSACNNNLSNDDLEESFELITGLEEIPEANNITATINRGQNVGTDSWFQIDLKNIGSNGKIANGLVEGWCLEWRKPLRANNDVHNGIKAYSTLNNDKWKPLNYFFSIKNDLMREDKSLTASDIQAVVWTIAGDMDIAPKFDVTRLSNSELPSRLITNGEPNFSKEKVTSIISRVRQEYNSVPFDGFNGNVLVTSDDEQDIYTEPVQDPGTVIGLVVDALTSEPLPGATVEIDGFTTTTGADGTFSFTDLLLPGTYSLNVSLDGYSGTTVNSIEVTEEETTDLGTIAISQNLATGEFRIVLTWGETPRDLDSHLTGPTSSDDRFHVWYNNRTNADNTANLDRDDVTSIGPETITISQRFDGTYRYSVHDYTNRISTNSPDLSNSGATVRVFDENGQVAEFTPPDDDGTLWTVFELDGLGGSITPVNTMGYNNSIGSTVTRAVANRTTDAEIIGDAVSSNSKN